MTKKEQAAMEAALTASALRSTSPVDPDIQPPNSYQKENAVIGWTFFASLSDGRVEQGWTTGGSHGTGQLIIGRSIGSQHPKCLYSQRLNALKQLRYEMEQLAAAKLRRIDKMIEGEIANPTPLS